MSEAFRLLALDKNNRPPKHWAGRTQAVKVFMDWVDRYTDAHVRQDEATEIVEELLDAYLAEQR